MPVPVLGFGLGVLPVEGNGEGSPLSLDVEEESMPERDGALKDGCEVEEVTCGTGTAARSPLILAEIRGN